MPDKTYVAGDRIYAADANLYLTHTGGAWNSYTPAFVGLTVGNGALTGKWYRSGRLITFKVRLAFGTSTTITAAVSASLPTAYADGTEVESFSGLMFDSSVNLRFQAMTFALTTTTFGIRALALSGGHLAQVDLSATVPFTWATGDALTVSGTYEAAS